MSDIYTLKPAFIIKYDDLSKFGTKLNKYKYFNKGYGRKRYYKYSIADKFFYYNDTDKIMCSSSGCALGVPALLLLGFTEEQIKNYENI